MKASHPSRRTIVKGSAWAAPVVLVGTAAPMSTASPIVCTVNHETPSSWSTTGDKAPSGATVITTTSTPTGHAMNVTFTAAAGTGTTLDPTYNMTFDNKGTNVQSSSKQIGNSADLGVVVNSKGDGTSGSGNQTVTIQFAQPVQNIEMYFRDLSYFTAGTQEAISFNVDTTITNSIKKGEPGIALNVSGAVAANTQIYRTGTGTQPDGTNGYYYDLDIKIAGPLSSFSFTFGYGPSSSTSKESLLAQVRSLTFCSAS